jgi:hypothetical protein
VSHNRIKPGTVNVVCTNAWHSGNPGAAATTRGPVCAAPVPGVERSSNNRVAAATMRWISSEQLVPLWGVRVYPYESGIDMWGVKCRCGKDKQMSEARWRQVAQVPAGLTRVDLDIMSL